ncbi:tRNA lysidine(34) synthetase TilS [Thioalkalivibrio sp. ALJ24]|uniref:tRNA lysidine(34) synthetase TilS n=1 Tax=Thioalkalivibrio sp. ALJ24 TaxID=545276 RepID=UPI00036B5FE0|nr:tRNA lysidine(34) synthetase TilS [Thioalkalivibrio sp. ALJ24]
MPSRKPAPDPVDVALRRFLTECPAGGPLRVAFSGGRDSTVLLHALTAACRAANAPDPEAWHVDHGLHAQAGAQAEHCRAVAHSLGLRFEYRRVRDLDRADEGVEAAARHARYALLREGLGPAGVLVTAHHAGDQAETFLLAALRGSGPQGLRGMAPWRFEGEGWLARPLLEVGEAALAARAAGLTWVEDPSNADLRFDRNFLRREILPRLNTRFAATGGLARAAHWQAEVAAVDETALGRVLAATGAGGHLPLAALRVHEPARRRALLRHWIRDQGLRPPGHRRLEEFLRQALQAGADRQPRLDWGAGCLRRYRDALYLDPPEGRDTPGDMSGQAPATAADATVIPWPARQHRLRLPDGRVLTREHPAFADPQLAGAVEVVFRRGGERVPVGGHHRRLKSLMQEQGIPPWRRDRIPLLRPPGGTPRAVIWPRGSAAGMDAEGDD